VNKRKLLDDLSLKIDACPFCEAKGNKLQHILGGGAVDKPNYFFVLINPTYRNITSDPGYQGTRIPFMGVSNFWRTLVESKFLPEKTYLTTERRIWSRDDISTVLNLLRGERLYLTNLVKCCGSDASLPNKEVIEHQTEILMQEIKIVNPRLIVTFGIIPFRALTGRSIKLSNHLKRVRRGNLDLYETIPITNDSYKVFPTFFPVGRGKPAESAELLKRLKK